MKLLLILLSFICPTKEEIYQVMDSLQIHHQEIVYAQIILETGNFTSKGCRNYNNLVGIMRKGRLRRYKHWSESLVDYKKLIQSRYRKGEDYYVFLRRIRYARNPNYTKQLKRYVSYNKSK